MAGFLVTNLGVDVECDMQNPVQTITKTAVIRDVLIKLSVGKKFANDCLNDSVDEDFFVLDGIILNKKQLIHQLDEEDFLHTVSKMKHQDKTFFKKLRGEFCGAQYDNSTKKWTFFTNHLGNRSVFYWLDQNKFIVSSDFNWLVKTLKEAGISYNLNVEAFKSILSLGWCYSHHTIIEEVKKLTGAQVLEISEDSIGFYNYHRFNNKDFVKQTEDEIIENIDLKFCNAVQMEYEKDIEYGYKHLAGLSGGLDSRMNVWVSNKLGYTDSTLVTFGQSGQEDIMIASQIAKKLKYPHFIKTLDDARFIEDIPKAVYRSYGLMSTAGIIHGNSMIEALDKDKFGLYHTGQIGDVVLGSAWRNNIRPIGLVGAGSGVKLIQYDSSFENEELYMLYERQAHWTRGAESPYYEETPIVSPFADVDFMEYVLSIPLKYRYNHYIYKKWIMKKYPEAAEFTWEKLGYKISDSENYIEMMNKIKAIKARIQRKPLEKIGMNLCDVWYKENFELRSTLHSMFRELMKTKYLDNKMKNDVFRLYKNGTCMYKIMVISALWSVNIFFDKQI